MNSTIREFHGKDIMFFATHLIEFFSVPLPSNLDETKLLTSQDLFRISNHVGYHEIYLANSPTIEGKSEANVYTFSMQDFLRWQLERVNEDTLWQLISKTGAAVTEILELDIELDKDPDYDPVSWLSPYMEDEYSGKALTYIARLRRERPEAFYAVLTESILDPQFGVLNAIHYETEISENLSEVREKYANWDVPLMVVSVGKFWPYIEKDHEFNLLMDDYRLDKMFVRNYDEGVPG